MSDDAGTPEAPRDAATWAPPDQGVPAAPTDEAPAGSAAPGVDSGDAVSAESADDHAQDLRPEQPVPKVPLDKPSTDRSPEPNPWAPPTETAPSGWATAPTPPYAHDQPTVTAVPGAGTPGPQPWDNPFAPPSSDAPFVPPSPGTPAPQPHPQPQPWGNPFAPPEARAPYPQPASGEPVPPPPIAPDGPGALPYGYGYPQYAPAPAQGAYQGVPGYGWPVLPPAPSNGMGTAGLVLGILAAVVFCLWPLAIVLGILGVIFGVIGRRKARRGEATNPGQALAGIICGAVGIALGIGMLVFLIVVPDDSGNGDSSNGDGFSTSLVGEQR